MKKSDLIKQNDFCYINTYKLEGEGFNMGQRVYVAGSAALPIDEDDLYLQRIYVYVHLIDNKDDVLSLNPQLYVIDPRSLTKCKKNETKRLTKWIKEMMEAMIEKEDETIN